MSDASLSGSFLADLFDLVPTSSPTTQKDGVLDGDGRAGVRQAHESGQMGGMKRNKQTFVHFSVHLSLTHSMMDTLDQVLSKVGVMMHPTVALWHFHIALLMSG